MSPSVRIAAVQARPVSDLFDDLWNGGDVARAVELLEAAARGGAGCVCFPELYPRVGEAEVCAAAWWPGSSRARGRAGTTPRP
jgi:predicted amidohydrolase